MCKIVVCQGTAIESKMCQSVEYKLSKVSVSESIVPISTCQGVGGGCGTFDDKCVRVKVSESIVSEYSVSEFNVSKCQSTVCHSLLCKI